MKRSITALFFTLVLVLININLLAQFEYKPDSNPKSGAEYCYMKKINSKNLPLLESSYANIKHSFDVLNYTLDLDLYANYKTPYPKNFTGTNIITLKADSAISSISLNAVNSSLQIDSVSLSGVSFTHQSNILNITLDREYAVGETLDVMIYYKHKNVADNAFYVSGGFVFTDCEPEGARKWFPCWDKPSDKATLNLRAKTPANVKLASNGRLADSVKTGDTIYYNWISRDPIATYIMIVTSKANYNLDIINYVSSVNPDYNFPIRFYYNTNENVTNAKALLPPVTDFFISKFGPHPFEKNGFATLNNQFTWGGMENQSLTSLCPGCWQEMLIVHEYAHQWFGDMITCATWADIFLNEGFATYLESLWLEHKSGLTAYKADVKNNAQTYLNGNPGWAISPSEWAVTTPSSGVLFDYSITYCKAAAVMHLLRYVAGDSVFFSAVYNYANDPELKYKSAVIGDLIAHFNTVSATDMNWFFHQWVYSPNHPVYANKYYVDQNKLGFIAKQTQTNTVFFKMPIEILVKFADGTPDTLIKVFNDQNEQHFVFSFNNPVLSCLFDPDSQIVLKKATLELINPPTGIKEEINQPSSLHLDNNYPNPFNPETTISFNVPEAGFINLSVYNALGQLVSVLENGFLKEGSYIRHFNGKNLSSGTYICVLKSETKTLTNKMTLVK